jgi:hypothetical protein
MTLSRRTFIKGLAAAPFTASAISRIFQMDVRGEEIQLRKKAEPGLHTRTPDLLYRQAISMGNLNSLTDKKFKQAEKALAGWIREKRITTNPKCIRFFYSVDDFGNEVGIAASIYSKPTEHVGVTWGQVVRLVKAEMRNA